MAKCRIRTSAPFAAAGSEQIARLTPALAPAGPPAAPVKLLCHNVVVVHQATIELGIDGVFWPVKGDKPRDVLPLVRQV